MLTKKSKIFSDQFISRIAELLRNYIAPDKIDKFILKLEEKTGQNYFSPSVEYNIQRILETNYDRIGFVFDSFRYPHYLEILYAIASSSNFLTEIVIKNPEYLYLVLKPENLQKQINNEELTSEISKELANFRSFNSKLNILKSIKRRYTLLIGLNDILGLITLQEVTNQNSILAKSLLSGLFNACLKEVADKFLINPPKIKHCLIGLGKLGGGELNYSSDVDLMLVYDKNSKIGKNKSIEYFDFISQVIQLFSSSSTNINEKGFLYRIDFRLRPDGKNAPLCRTFSDTVKYYETRGEDWERQMLIKSGFINGDINIYKRFVSYLTPFIFPSSFSNSPLLQIAKMKKNIERQFPDEHNIKVCRGGIRDIEFVLQALQLINGGKNPDLHTGNSMIALDLLTQKGFLNQKEKNLLKEAYVFYRQIEHFLQLDNDKQTHSIPTEIESREKLFTYLGFKDQNKFLRKLDIHKKSVATFFNKMTKSKADISSLDEKFSLANFTDSRRAKATFDFIKKGLSPIGQKSFDNKTIRLFENFEPGLFSYLIASSAPDKILDNFAKIIRNISFPSILYTEFQNKEFLNIFLKICEYSQKAIDMMATDKSLIDFFITRQVFSKNYEDLNNLLTVNKFTFLLSIQLALKLINTENTSKLLSNFLTQKIKKVVEDQKINCDYFIGGLGSFGTKEMTFASDTDLLFISQNVENTYKVQKDFEELVLKINKEITPFKIDLRLRPEGNKGPLVWDLSKLKTYFSTRARIWEFQSLHKLRFITGNKKIYDSLKSLIIKNVESLDYDFILNEINFMRGSIKQSRMMVNTIVDLKNENGGISDINFYIDQYTLRSSKLYAKTFSKTRTEVLKIINGEETILKLYKLIRQLELLDQNISNSSNSKLSADNQMNKTLEVFCNSAQDGKLIDKLKNDLSECYKTISDK